MSKVKLPVNKIKPGMYLVGIDIPWMKSPFLKHRFLISTTEEVKKIKDIGVKVVDIDTEKSVVSLQDDKPVENIRLPLPPKAPKPNSFNKEIALAKTLKLEAKKHLNQAFDTAAMDAIIKPETLTRVVEKSTVSLMRNGHALLSLFHEKPKGKSLINHSFNVMSLSLMMDGATDGFK